MSSRFRVLSIGTVLLVGAACSDSGGPPETALDTVEQGVTGTYRLRAVHSSKCVDVQGGVTATNNGANVQQWSCGTNTNQQWQLTDCGNGIHLLKAVHSGLFMNVYGGSTPPSGTDNGANIQQWGTYSCSSSSQNVKFRLIDRGGTPKQYALQAQHSGKCVDVSGGVTATADGQNIHQWDCHYRGNQLFTLEPVSGSTPPPPTSGLPSGWSNRDIGSVAATGSASYSNGVYTVKGSGADIWGSNDGFQFVYRQFSGDGSITARVPSLVNTNAWAKAGVMFRESLNSNSEHALMAVTPTNGVAFQRRTSTGGSSAHTGSSGGPGYWVRLERSGSNFTAKRSSDGSSWSTVGSASIPMNSTAYVGLAVTSHADGTLTTATFSNVSVQSGGTTPPPPSGVTWSPANLTWYTSWPSCCPEASSYDPNADKTECVVYNGCTWAGYFAGVSGRQSEEWVKSHNIIAVHEKDFSKYRLKTFRLRKDGKEIDAVVYDMCSDSDCNGCCTKNASANGYDFLIDVEKYTKEKWGITNASGRVDWYCTNC